MHKNIPEKHKDLIVRVAGYSAFFNVLSKKLKMILLAELNNVYNFKLNFY